MNGQVTDPPLGLNRAETWTPPEIQPAVYLPAPEAAQRVYERGSIAEMLQRMFNEAEQYPAAWQSEQDYAWAMHPSDTVAYQNVIRDIQAAVKHSDAVNSLRQKVEQGTAIEPADVTAVFRAYEQAFRRAVAEHKTSMSARQMNVLKFQARSELDYSFRDVITQHLIAAGERQMKFDPLDFFLLVNPKARKVDYMSKGEILATLRHSMSLPTMTGDRLKNDLRAVETRSDHHDFSAITASQEYHQLMKQVEEK